MESFAFFGQQAVHFWQGNNQIFVLERILLLDEEPLPLYAAVTGAILQPFI